MQYQRLGLSHLGRALLDQGFAATPTSTHNIACKPLPCVFAPLGLLTLFGAIDQRDSAIAPLPAGSPCCPQMAPPIAHRKQYLLNEMQARFCCPGKKTFTDTIELGRCLGLWVILARILTQPLIDAHEQWKASIGRSAIASMPVALWTLSGYLERPRSPVLISLWTLSGWCCPARGHPWLPDMPDSALRSANPGVPAPLRGPKMHDLADHPPWGRQDALRVRIPGIWMSFGVTGGRDGLIRSPAAPASTRASG